MYKNLCNILFNKFIHITNELFYTLAYYDVKKTRIILHEFIIDYYLIVLEICMNSSRVISPRA